MYEAVLSEEIESFNTICTKRSIFDLCLCISVSFISPLINLLLQLLRQQVSVQDRFEINECP